MNQAPLPQGWEQKTDQQGRVYFVDHIAQGSTWDDPRNFPLPQGWEEKVDQNTRKRYWVDHNNQTSSWTDPRQHKPTYFNQPQVAMTGMQQQVVQPVVHQTNQHMVYNDPYGIDPETNFTNGILQAVEPRSRFYLKQPMRNRECIELATGCEMENRFELYDANSRQLMFNMKEHSNCCIRQFCGKLTAFEMTFQLPGNEKPLLVIDRPFKCTDTDCCCPCSLCVLMGCGQEASIISNGEIVGTVKEEYGSWCCNGYFSAYDRHGKKTVTLEAPLMRRCAMCCCSDVIFDFDLHQPQYRPQVGTITRKWICKCCNLVADLDNFEIEMDQNAEFTTESKLLTLALAVLMKYVYFEEKNNQ